MKKTAYQRQPEDFEIRFLKDGRVVFVGPDQELVDLAQSLKAPQQGEQERNSHGTTSETPPETE